MKQPNCLPSERRINLHYVLLQACFWGMCAVFMGYQTALLLSRGFTSGQAGVFASIRCLAGIFVQPLIGSWADRHPKIPLQWIFSGSLLICFGVNLLFAQVSMGFWGTAAVFVALGALELTAYPLLDSMGVQYISAGFNLNFGLGRGMGAVGYGVVCVAVGWQAERFGVESILLTHGLFILILMVLVFLFPAVPGMETARKLDAKSHSAAYLLRKNPSFALFLLAVFFSMFAIAPLNIFTVNIVNDRGGSTAALGAAQFFMAMGEIPGALMYQRLHRRFGSTRVLLLALCGVVVRPLLSLLSPSLGLFMVANLSQIIGYGIFVPAGVYFANENVPPEDRVQGQSLLMVAGNGLGGVIGNLVGGALIDVGGVNLMMGASLTSACVAVVIALAAYRMKRRATTVPA